MLVSAIMPTRGRPAFAREALACYLSQTWRDKELIVLDDEDDPSFPVYPDISGVRYYRTTKRLAVGEKRNLCCGMAKGSIVIHFDDDDWSAPGRMTDQVNRLIESRKQVTGYCSMRFQRRSTNECWWFRGSAAMAMGTSQCYLRSFWASHRFGNVQIGEDTEFADGARRQRQLISVSAGDLMVSWVHDSHTSERMSLGQNDDMWRKGEPLMIKGMND